jgi:predicted secreted protein
VDARSLGKEADMELGPDAMTRQVAFLTHSLLNPAADAGRHPAPRGPVLPLVSTLRDLGCELVQLPAAEVGHLGVRRWWQSREMLDTPGFRAHCRRLAGPVLRQVEQFRAAGYDAVVIGADGSPSCGVRTTAGEAGWGGRPTEVDDPVPVAGEGVWIEVLRAAFADAGLTFPRATGFDVGLADAEMPHAVHELRRFLRQSATRFAE